MRLKFIVLVTFIAVFIIGCGVGGGEVTLNYHGSKYVGEVKDGVPHGYGKHYWPNGELLFEGEWRNDTWHNGTIYNDVGIKVYTGDFRDGDLHGQGKLFYENGKVEYEGQWYSGLQHGQGTMYDETGNIIYSGEWNYGDPVN